MRRKTTNEKLTGVVVPQATLDFVMRPKRVPHPGTHSLDVYLASCRDHFLKMIVDALRGGALPERTRVVQCVAKESHSATDFSYRAVCRGNRRTCMEMAAAFVHVTEGLSRPGGRSSHQRAREKGDINIGNLILFSTSTKCGIEHQLPFPAHACFIGLQSEEAPQIPHEIISQYFSGGDDEQEMWLFDMSQCVSDHRKHATPCVVNSTAKAKVIDAKSFPHTAAQESSGDTGTSTTRALLRDIVEDEEYLNRVAVLSNRCQIAISAPQVVFHGDAHEHNAAYDSGLTLLLEGDEPISTEELLQIFIVSRSLAQYLASVYGLVREVVRAQNEAIVTLLSKALTHEVGNLGGILKIKFDALDLPEGIRKDLEARVDIADLAARAVFQQLDNCTEVIATQTTNIVSLYSALSDFFLTLDIKDEPLMKRKAPMAFSLGLNEMLRNAYKHALQDGKQPRAATCRVHCSGASIVVEVTNKGAENAKKKVEQLLNHPKPQDKGLRRLRELAGMLKHGKVSSIVGHKDIAVSLHFTS